MFRQWLNWLLALSKRTQDIERNTKLGVIWTIYPFVKEYMKSQLQTYVQIAGFPLSFIIGCTFLSLSLAFLYPEGKSLSVDC